MAKWRPLPGAVLFAFEEHEPTTPNPPIPSTSPRVIAARPRTSYSQMYAPVRCFVELCPAPLASRSPTGTFGA
jgi:hypothetical protein